MVVSARPGYRYRTNREVGHEMTTRPRAARTASDAESSLVEEWPDGTVSTPEKDPFYRPPTGFENADPGTVLRRRPVRLALLGVIPQRVSAWQLLFRTQDLEGRACASVTTILTPETTEPVGGRPLLSYQCAIDAVADRCFPSYALRAGARARGALPQFELFIILYALRRGWVISIPDHEGSDGHWGAPMEPGYCTLDAVRASLSCGLVGLDSSTPVALWGYSGGGLATSWAAETAGDYAPELDIVGAALGSPVGDPASAFARLNGTFYAALPTMVVAGLRRTYPALDRTIREHVEPKGLAILDSVQRMTTMHAMVRLAKHDLDQYTTIPLADVMATPELVQMFVDIQPGRSAPDFPLLVVQAVHDPIIAADDVDGQVERYRDAGAHVTYLRDRLSDHIMLHPLSTPLNLDWIADRFAGRPLPAPRTETVWSTALSVRGISGLLSFGLTAGKALVGRPLR